MLSTEIARQIRGTSISEQIEIIELILHSLKTKFETKNESSRKPFRPFGRGFTNPLRASGLGRKVRSGVC